jgi:hypothetical protein
VASHTWSQYIHSFVRIYFTGGFLTELNLGLVDATSGMALSDFSSNQIFEKLLEQLG